MKRSLALTLCFCCLVVVFASHAADFKQSKVTQVVNDVQIISAADQTKKTASVNDVFTMPDVLRTGPSSRAELVAEDDTVTRVGANTIFSFDPASRTIDLQQGSLLFHSPHGKGGGTIHTGSATASVLGSTLIVSATPNGGFKVISLEDQAEIKFLNGLHQQLSPGQMTYILPGGNQLAPIVIFRMDDLTQNSLLVKGFNHPLASMPLILHEIEKQIKLIQSGKATDTGLLAGDNATSDQVEVLDANTVQSEVNPQNTQTANFTDPNLIDMRNANLSAYGVVNMTANTINLFNVSFKKGSIDSFGTRTGLATVNASTSVPGYLNLHNVSYGGTPITSTSQIKFSSGPGSTPGFYSYKKP